MRQIAALLGVVLFVTGCAGLKAGNTTKVAVQALKAQGAAAGVVAFPGGMLDPALPPGTTVTVPALVGKTVSLKAWYDDGQPKYELHTDPSPGFESLFGALSGYDAGKYQADAQQREFTMTMLQYLIAQAQPYGQAGLSEWQATRDYRRANPTVSGPSSLDRAVERLDAIANTMTGPSPSPLDQILERLDAIEGAMKTTAPQ